MHTYTVLQSSHIYTHTVLILRPVPGIEHSQKSEQYLLYDNCRDCRTSYYTYRVVVHVYIYSRTVVMIYTYTVLILLRVPGIEHSQQSE